MICLACAAKMEAIKGLSSDKIELLILEVQERPIIWDKADRNYKDHDTKEVIWNKIGEEVDLAGDRVKKVWCNLRDTRTRYMREDKKSLTSGSGQKKGKLEGWKWARALDFLSNADYANSTVSSIQASQNTQEEEEASYPEDSDNESIPALPSQRRRGENESSTPKRSATTEAAEGQSPQAKLTPGKRNKKQKSTDELESVYMSYIKDKQTALQSKEKDPHDEADKQWLLSLLPNFQDMSLRKKNILKYKIQGLFLEEDENNPPSNTSQNTYQPQLPPYNQHFTQTYNPQPLQSMNPPSINLQHSEQQQYSYGQQSFQQQLQE